MTATGGEAAHARASGVARSDDGQLDLVLRLPIELGGEGGGTNPEQLSAAAYAARFMARSSCLQRVTKSPYRTPASRRPSVVFGRDPVDGLFMLMADETAHLPGVEKGLAEQLVRGTERYCPHAKMARGGNRLSWRLRHKPRQAQAPRHNKD